MTWLHRTNRFFQLLFRKRRLEDDLDAEVQAYMKMLMDRHVAAGMPEEDALRAARIEFEGIEQVKEQVREVRVGANFETILQDIRYAWRSLIKSRAFTAIAIITLALGIGVNTAIFSVVYAVLLRPLPYDRPEQLAFIWSHFKFAANHAPSSGPALFEILHRNRLLKDAGGIWVGNGTFTGDVNPEQVKVGFVTTNFFQLLGVRPALGRTFLPDEDFSNRPAIMLSYGLWQRRFGGDPSIVGKEVTFFGASCTVIGVMPAEFQLYFPQESNVPNAIGAYFPYTNAIYKRPRNLYFLRIITRLKPGVTPEQAQADLNEVATQMRANWAEFADDGLKLELAPMQRDVVHEVRPALVALFAGAGFVLLICCLNVANLLLTRASERRKEIAVRAALGASQGRIVRQLLMEGLVLSAVSAVFGVAVGWISLRALLSIRPEYLSRMPDVGLNLPVLGFVAAVSLAAAIFFALAPGIESAKSELMVTLREAGRTTGVAARRNLRTVLIVGEITLGFILVIGAGLMIRTLLKIQQVNPGFEAQHVLTFDLDLGKFRRPDRINFVHDWEAQVAAIPGVESAGGISHLPLGTYSNWYSPYRPEGLSAKDAASLEADYRAITPGYLRAMGTRVLEGRLFDDQDRENTRQVVIVDDMLARTAWPGESAIGKKIEAEHFTSKGIIPVWSEVIGVVEHIHNHSLSAKKRGEIYIPFTQTPREMLTFTIRTRMEPGSLAETIRRELHKRDKDLALSNVRPMIAYVDQATAPARFTAVLAGCFAGLALLLAAVGIYGVVSYSISRRMPEMGVRMALGASSGDVLRLVMREGLILTAVGLILGLGGALAISQYMSSLIYGISAVDPVTYIAALAVIPAAAMLGCWRPASRAASANPVDALRAE
jgi:putative ABC transport system permease protein